MERREVTEYKFEVERVGFRYRKAKLCNPFKRTIREENMFVRTLVLFSLHEYMGIPRHL